MHSATGRCQAEDAHKVVHDDAGVAVQVHFLHFGARLF